jgi:hypothetical protein
MFHSLPLADRYVDEHIVGRRYTVTSFEMDAEYLRKLHLEDTYSPTKMDVWVETVDIMDACLFDNVFIEEEVSGREDDCWAPVDRQTIKDLFLS